MKFARWSAGFGPTGRHILQELSSWTKDYYDLKPEDISRAIQATEEQTNIPLKPYAPANNQPSSKKWRVNPRPQSTSLSGVHRTLRPRDCHWPGGNRQNLFGHGHGALAALTQKQVSRIILARPAVEAGEHLGFLPGTSLPKSIPIFVPL